MKRDVEMTNLLGAVERLDEVLREPKSDIVRDSAVKRFELCTDMAWKLVKTHIAERHGIVCSSPKSYPPRVFHGAFQEVTCHVSSMASTPSSS